MKNPNRSLRRPLSRQTVSAKSAGFTLVEIMIVVVIIGLLSTIVITKAPMLIARVKATTIKSYLAEQIAPAITDVVAKYNRLPITEAADATDTVPALYSSTADLTYGQVTAAEVLFARELISERPQFKLGTNPAPIIDPAIVDFNRATERFVAAAATGARVDYSAGRFNRIETYLVTSSAADPATANGANFYLHETGVGLPQNAVVWVAVLEDIKHSEARALAEVMNDIDVNPREGQPQSLGRVAYSVPAEGQATTTAYIYLTHVF